MLYDQQNRCIDYLRVSVTDHCNLSCLYCNPRHTIKSLPRKEILSYEEILRIVSVAVPLGITHLRVTGGNLWSGRGSSNLSRP